MVEESQQESVAVVEGFEERVCEFSTVPILVLMEFDETGVLVQVCFGGEFVRSRSDSLEASSRAPPN